MHKVIIGLLILFASSTFAVGQTGMYYFKTFEDYKTNRTSSDCEYLLKQRTNGDIFMMGGISNYRLKKIQPKTKTDELTQNAWAILFEDSVYINSYPYSEIVGFNKILGTGHYAYFIGEPARTKDKQIELGIIQPGQPQMAVCCQTSYVILPEGAVKWLTPQLLAELLSDNQELTKEFKKDRVNQSDANKMFDYLRKYNEMK